MRVRFACAVSPRASRACSGRPGGITLDVRCAACGESVVTAAQLIATPSNGWASWAIGGCWRDYRADDDGGGHHDQRHAGLEHRSLSANRRPVFWPFFYGVAARFSACECRW